MVANQAHEIKRLRTALEPFVRAAGFHCIEAQADESTLGCRKRRGQVTGSLMRVRSIDSVQRPPLVVARIQKASSYLADQNGSMARILPVHTL
jgi:hypothetical protein